MECSCCGKDESETTFYKIKGGYRKKCMQCTKDVINARYKNDEEYRNKKQEYARFMNPFRDSRAKGSL